MTNWRRTINIKQYLDPDKLLVEVRDPVVGVLRGDCAYSSDPDFAFIVDDMAEAETVADFDLCLSVLYDWADDSLVWIGPT